MARFDIICAYALLFYIIFGLYELFATPANHDLISKPLNDLFDKTGLIPKSHNVQGKYGINDRVYARDMNNKKTKQTVAQLYHDPIWAPLYPFDYEKDYDPDPMLDHMKRMNYSYPIICVILYICMIAPRLLEESDIKAKEKAANAKLTPAEREAKKKAADEAKKAAKKKALENPKAKSFTTLAAWNLFLSLFSAWGMIRTVPHLIKLITTVSFQETVCLPASINFGVSASGLAAQMFCLSKLPELIDTIFTIVKGKTPIFLHWYHHITVLLYCWNSYVTESSAGIYFIAMNYTVHAIMYFYYFMNELGIVPKWFKTELITSIQLAQMFGGMFIVGSSIHYYYETKGNCSNQTSTLICGFLMYASYAYLFLEFFIGKYLTGSSQLPAAAAAETKKSK